MSCINYLSKEKPQDAKRGQCIVSIRSAIDIIIKYGVTKYYKHYKKFKNKMQSFENALCRNYSVPISVFQASKLGLICLICIKVTYYITTKPLE